MPEVSPGSSVFLPEAKPRRLLVVSATIGEGHNATAAAVEERAATLWPNCVVRRVDTLDVMGRGTGPVFRWIYRVNVDRTPWLYDFFYRQLWRWPWFAAASCRFTSAWAGRALAPIVAEFRPDLVVSTYPLGTGGLDWLRRRGELEVPLVAWISDFAPHPFWVYSEVDLHYVASEASLAALRRARPDARGAVGAPPVVSAFHPRDRKAARAELRLPEDRPVALISCGSLGFGSVERAVDASLAADPTLCVVVVCGRNESLRARLAARAQPEERLVPLGWTDRMPELTAAADVVITNAGGATALEALATQRSVLLFEPIAGHGKANAALMERAGLGRVCPDAAALTRALRTEVLDATARAAAEQRAAEHVARFDFEAEVAGLPELPRHRGSRPMSASDALFLGAATAEAPQQVGAVLRLEDGTDSERIADRLRDRVTERAVELPLLRRVLQVVPHRRPRWSVADELDPDRHISTQRVAETDWGDALREFFAEPLPTDRPPWRLRVLSDGTRTAVLAALHHALGDGIAVTATLLDLVRDNPATPATPVTQSAPAAPTRSRRWTRPGASAGLSLVDRLHGLLGLVTRGSPLSGSARRGSAERRFGLLDLPAARVRAAARAMRASTSAVLLGALGEALYRHGVSGRGKPERLRIVVPMTTRRVRRGFGAVSDEPAGNAVDEPAGNNTAAVLLDLPVGPMDPRRRVTEVAEELNRTARPGQLAAARLAVRALGVLPSAPHARLARLMYSGRFFSAIASVMPGRRRTERVLGTRLTAVYPVLPLADGVGLGVGFLPWGDVLGIGITADPALFADVSGFTRTLNQVCAELTGSNWRGVDG